ncbi:MAG: hypothetical protein SGARI_000842 [Bacillariaceae sp.]
MTRKAADTATTTTGCCRFQAGKTVIILKGERRSRTKRKFNSQKALVVAAPHRGCWLTIQPLANRSGDADDADTPDVTLKWRKGSCQVLDCGGDDDSKIAIRKDPVGVLTDEVWLKVLSFVHDDDYDDDNDGTYYCNDVVTAAKRHAKVRSVSKSWQLSFDKALQTKWGTFNANLNIFAQ